MMLPLSCLKAGSGCSVFSMLKRLPAETKTKAESKSATKRQLLDVNEQDIGLPCVLKDCIIAPQLCARVMWNPHSSQLRNLAWQYGQTSNSSNSSATKLGPAESWSTSNSSASRNCRSHREQYLEIPGSCIASRDKLHRAVYD